MSNCVYCHGSDREDIRYRADVGFVSFHGNTPTETARSQALDRRALELLRSTDCTLQQAYQRAMAELDRRPPVDSKRAPGA